MYSSYPVSYHVFLFVFVTLPPFYHPPPPPQGSEGETEMGERKKRKGEGQTARETNMEKGRGERRKGKGKEGSEGKTMGVS